MSDNYDEQIATDIMGWYQSGIVWHKKMPDTISGFSVVCCVWDWQPTIKIEHAMEVVDKLYEKGFDYHIYRFNGIIDCVVVFEKGTGADEKYETYEATAKTVQLAICRAALRTIRGE